MSLTENMSELVGGGHRSHRGKHMTKRHRKKQSSLSPLLSNKSVHKRRHHSHKNGKKRKSIKGGISNQLVPWGFLASLLALGPKRRKRSRRHHKFNLPLKKLL